MENGMEEEWEIVDYYPGLEDEGETGKSKLGWVIDAGLNVGKKLVITGVVISSVPLVVPPLVVISALGFAFSVPFGVVFASYACTQNVMSKLLPSPPPLDFIQTVGPHDEEADLEGKEHSEGGIAMKIKLVDDVYDGDGHIDDNIGQGEQGLARDDFLNNAEVGIEEDEEKEDVNGGTEMKIELMDNDYDGDGQRDVNIIREEQEGLSRNDFLNKIEVGEEDERKKYLLQQEKPSCDVVKTNDYALVAQGLTKTRDGELDGKNNGTSQEELDANVGVVVQVQTDDKLMEINEGGKNVMDNKEREDSLNEEVEKVIIQTKKHQSNSKELERRGKKKQKFHGKRKEAEKVKRLEKEKDFLSESNTSSENMNVGGQVGVGDKSFSVDEASTDGLSKEHTVLEREELDRKQSNDLLLNDNIDNSKEKNVGFKDGAVPETAKDESNGGVVEGKIEQCTVMVYDDSGVTAVTYSESRIIGDDGDYSLEIAVASASTSELGNDEQIHGHLKEEKDTRGSDGGLHCDEGLFRGEKIWEKIDAIRGIVGFKAPRCSSYFEELKALYLFTGIEPPSSSDSCDFADFRNKLSFLMSVIGLK